LLNELIRRAPQDPDKEIRELVNYVESGDPGTVAVLAQKLIASATLSTGNQQRVRKVEIVAKAVDLILKGRYSDGAVQLENIADVDPKALVHAKSWRRVGAIRDALDTQASSYAPTELCNIFAMEYARYERIEQLGQRDEAFLSYCRLMEWAV